MHMADALLSPAVGATMWLASGAALALAARRVRAQADDRLVPLMGVLGAFVFAAQMLNFAIPGTGSSGHLGGGLLLAILLGPHAGLIVIASVLTVQALFFADGGLLALGANMFNLGVLPCWLAYPLVYRALAPPRASAARVTVAAVIAAVVGLQLGALGVVLQTVVSGVASLPLSTFALLMQPIHFAIGVVEGLATATVVLFIRRSRPDLLGEASPRPASLRPLLASIAAVALAAGGALAWFASTQPDGLEWSIEHTSGGAELPAPQTGVHAALAALQQRLAFLPDYALPRSAEADEKEGSPAWPDVNGETSLAGVIGALLTLAVVWLAAAWLKRTRRRGGA